MWMVFTSSLPALWRASTRASLGGASPSSEGMTSMGRGASFGARFTKFHLAALAMTSLARLSGVQPASGAMSCGARPAATPLVASSCLSAGEGGEGDDDGVWAGGGGDVDEAVQ